MARIRTDRRHEWLRLIEISGPFLSPPVLQRAFPQGLDAHDPEILKAVRQNLTAWEESGNGASPRAEYHRAWIDFVLRDVLELPDGCLLEGQQIPPALTYRVPEAGETLRPDFALVNPREPATSALQMPGGPREQSGPAFNVQRSTFDGPDPEADKRYLQPANSQQPVANSQ
jgi:hypothetical protein